MKNKLSPRRVSLTLGSMSFIFSVVCLLLIAISPVIMIKLFGSIFHGIDITQITMPISWGNAILGVIVVTIMGLITGWLFTIIYNKFG